MVIVNERVAVCWGALESLTRMVKGNGPVELGVPEMPPEEFSDNPVGNEPEAKLQL